MIKYDEFVPVVPGMEQPDTITFKCDIIKKDGSRLDNQEVNQWTLHDAQDILAVRFHKPVDPVEQLYDEALKNLHPATYVKPVIKATIYWLAKNDKLKVDINLQTDWLDRKMDELNIRYDSDRKAVRLWFENPDKYPEVCRDIDNAILTVKPSGGGRVVVLPTGHTIAYTTAQKIWYAMNGDEFIAPSHPTVAIYRGNYQWRYSKSYKVIIDKSKRLVSVGCQRVPFTAIEELAAREAWPKVSPYRDF